MANYRKHQSSDTTKALVVGDSGSGKSSMIAGLAHAGFKVRVIDADNGLDVVAAHLKPEFVDNVSFITLPNETAELKDSKAPSAWSRFVQICTQGWKDEDEDLGKIQDWGPDTVLFIDTLNYLSKAAMRDTLRADGKSIDSNPGLHHYGDAARKMENRLLWLCSDSVKCNLVVTSHIRPIEDDLGRVRNYPSSAVGSNFSSNVASMFNTYVRIDSKGKGKDGKELRVFRTRSDNKMDLKVSAPNAIEPEVPYDVDGIGFADIIRRIQTNAQKMKGS